MFWLLCKISDFGVSQFWTVKWNTLYFVSWLNWVVISSDLSCSVVESVFFSNEGRVGWRRVKKNLFEISAYKKLIPKLIYLLDFSLFPENKKNFFWKGQNFSWPTVCSATVFLFFLFLFKFRNDTFFCSDFTLVRLFFVFYKLLPGNFTLE